MKIMFYLVSHTLVKNVYYTTEWEKAKSGKKTIFIKSKSSKTILLKKMNIKSLCWKVECKLLTSTLCVTDSYVFPKDAALQTSEIKSHLL